jgi:hypothetical protein
LEDTMTPKPATARALRGLLAGLALFGIGAQLAPASAQDRYPSRPVKIVVPFGAGGVADITARLVAEKLGTQLNQRFVIENQPAAGGVTAAKSVIASEPDGYTIALLSNGTARASRCSRTSASILSRISSRSRVSPISTSCSSPMQALPTRRWPTWSLPERRSRAGSMWAR